MRFLFFPPLRTTLLLAWLVLGPGALFVLAQPETAPTREQRIADRVVAEVNAFRQQRGLPPLASSPELGQAAVAHSQDMTRHDFFNHVSPVPGRARPVDRARAFGYPSSTIAENLFLCAGPADQEIPGQCVQAWADSAGHLRNMTDTLRTEIGVGVATTPAGETYITAVFGKP